LWGLQLLGGSGPGASWRLLLNLHPASRSSWSTEKKRSRKRFDRDHPRRPWKFLPRRRRSLLLLRAQVG